MAENPKPIAIFGIRGRNGSDPPIALPEWQCAEAMNVDFYRAGVARRRGGTFTVGASSLSSIASMIPYVPNADQATRELWLVDNQTGASTKIMRYVSGATIALAFAPVDQISSAPKQVNGATLGDKLFLAMDTAVNRLHVWDPTSVGGNPSDTKVRRVGLARPAAATVANTGGGTYAAITRTYKVAYLFRDASGDTRYRSNLSAAVTFTPSGGGTAARITKPASIAEDETHWSIYGALADGNYFLITTLAVGTTTYDDSALDYSTGVAAPDPNAFTPPPSAKYLIANDARIVMAGAWEAVANTGDAMTPSPNRIWWTSILGSTDEGDDERVNNSADIKSYDDIEEPVIGLGQSLHGAFYAFSFSGMWKFSETGDVFSPYQRFRMDGGAGCIAHKTIAVALDANGSPALYWLSPQGPFRLSDKGQEYMGQDIVDVWDRVNMDASATAHGVWHPDKHQIWWYLPVDGAVTPNLRIVFDTRLGQSTTDTGVRGGWSLADGDSVAAVCSGIMPQTSGSFRNVPAVGRFTDPFFLRCDYSASFQDAFAASFNAYLTTRGFAPWGLGQTGGIQENPLIVTDQGDVSTLGFSVIRDFLAETIASAEAPLDQEGPGITQTIIFTKAQGTRVARANMIQLKISDPAVVNSQWRVHAVTVPVMDEGKR